jgi:hypothetical protein
MADEHTVYSSGGYGPAPPPPASPLRLPFPFARLIYAVGFAFIAWFVFWFILILAVLQFVTRAVAGHVNDELRQFTRNMILYLQELLGYVALVRDERPFPIGRFPKGTDYASRS